MHLRSLRLRGFKSFPDSVELKLEPGVAVVVGPNGSGKSNVADAIVWAAGSLTPSELRAEKPDDVLFNGAEGRTPAESCEVELVFDNESGGFGELDFSEVSIARRLHRGGEGQYLVNRAQVRRTDLVELLADVGLGGSMHSIVSQGKVEAVLASKPEERRELVEEAAGLGKFKRRRHRAELKLDRVGIQVERARDVEAEVRKRLRPLALQATAAERAEKLADEIAGLRARIARARPRRGRRAPSRGRGAQDRGGDRPPERAGEADRAPRGAARRRGGARRRGRQARGGDQGALPAAGRDRADRAPAGRRAEPAGRACAASSARPRRPPSEVTDESTRELERATAEATAAARAPRLQAAPPPSARARPRSASRRSSAAAAARAEERLEALRRERQALETELADAAGGREGATAALYRLGTARERIAMRAESVSALRERVRVELAETEAAAQRPGPSPGRAGGGRQRGDGRRRAPPRTRATTSPSARRSRRSASRRSSARWPSARGSHRRRGCSPTRAPSWRSRCSTSRRATSGPSRPRSAGGASAVVAEDAAAGLDAAAARARCGSRQPRRARRASGRPSASPSCRSSPLDELLAATARR